ncbi:MAG TPA: hypothetical protein VGG71_08120 [Chitinophagaceae bacterium]|jgi:hypothetical protein
MKKIESIEQVREGDILTYSSQEHSVNFKILNIRPPSIFLLDNKSHNQLKIIISEMLISDDWFLTDEITKRNKSENLHAAKKEIDSNHSMTRTPKLAQNYKKSN